MEALMKCSFMKRFMNPNKIPLAPVHRNTIASCESKCRLHYDDLYDPMLKRVVDPSMKHVYLPANLQGKQTAFRTNLQPMFALVKREKTLGAQSFHPRTYFTLPSFRKFYAAMDPMLGLHYGDLYDSMLKIVIDPSMKHVYLPANLQVKREKTLGAQSFHPWTYFTLFPFRKAFAALEHNARVFAAGDDPEIKCMETFIYTPIKVGMFTSEVGVKHVNVGRNHKRTFCYSFYASWLGRVELNVKESPLHPYEKGSFCCLCNKEVEAP